MSRVRIQNEEITSLKTKIKELEHNDVVNKVKIQMHTEKLRLLETENTKKIPERKSCFTHRDYRL